MDAPILMEENQPTAHSCGRYRAIPEPGTDYWIFERAPLDIPEEDLKDSDWVKFNKTNLTEHTIEEYQVTSDRLAAGEGHQFPLIYTTPVACKVIMTMISPQTESYIGIF